MKTMLTLAQELDVPKLKVYRYIKKHLIETHQENGVIYIDETAEAQIISALQKTELHQENASEAYRDTAHDAAMIQLLESTIDVLKKQIEQKDKQIGELIELQRNQQILLKHEQESHQGGFWKRLFLSSKTVN